MIVTESMLYKIRNVYRLSLAEMGDLLDVSATYVHLIENGSRRLTETIRDKLVAEFDLTPEKLAEILRIYEEYNDIKERLRKRRPR